MRSLEYINLPDAAATSDASDDGVTAAVAGNTENLQFNKHFDF